MRKTDVIGILCADIHLSLTPPIWRSAEPDWLKAQQRPLDELRALQAKYYCPIICAGDIFDKWNSPPELINWAVDFLPEMYAIAGQHDLPNHNLSEINKSAYWTLFRTKKINLLKPEGLYLGAVGGMKAWFYGFSYGRPIQKYKSDKHYQICVTHQYVWTEGYQYKGAPADYHLTHLRRNFKGYDVVVFGDNHKGFLTKTIDGMTVFNCGSLMRRKSDEIDYKPQVGLLYDDGTVKPYYLDISKDKYLETCDDKVSNEELDMEGFVEELEKLGDTALDYINAVKQFCEKNKVRMETVKLLLQAMEKKNDKH